MKIILFSIPIFILSIIIEGLYTFLAKKKYFRINDSIGNLSLGIMEQLFEILFFTGFIGLFSYVEQNLKIATWSESYVGWLVAFVVIDLLYYWFHRVSHRVNIVWGSHIVHHQSEEYNLSVALRQGPFQRMFSFWFYLPLAFLGMPTEMYVSCFAVNLVYQFFIHTRLVKKFPRPVELIFNTPSHHRVHHGRNPKYLDKNYAGVFIVWDRWFGSFQEEQDEPVYGITKPLESFDPVWATFSYFATLFKESLKTKNIRDFFLVWLREPGWHPKSLGGFQEPPFVSRTEGFMIYDPVVSSKKRRVALIGFVIFMLGSLVVMIKGHVWSYGMTFLAASICIAGLSMVGRSLSVDQSK